MKIWFKLCSYRIPSNIINIIDRTTICVVMFIVQVMWKERRLRVFQNRILRRIFGEWRRLHNKELHSLYGSPNIVRMIKSRRLIWADHLAIMEESRSSFKILTGKPTGKRPLGRPRDRKSVV